MSGRQRTKSCTPVPVAHVNGAGYARQLWNGIIGSAAAMVATVYRTFFYSALGVGAVTSM